jgi:hypothetical protein
MSRSLHKKVLAAAAITAAMLSIAPVAAHAKISAGDSVGLIKNPPVAKDPTPVDDLAPQGPYSPWYGTVKSEVALYKASGQLPQVFQDPDNTNVNSGNRAKVYMSIRDGIAATTNACLYGSLHGGGLSGCKSAPTKVDWPTNLCEQIFQQIRSNNTFADSFFIGKTVAMTKAVACGTPTDGTLTAARTAVAGHQCLDFEYLVDPNIVQWEEQVGASILHVRFKTTYRFAAKMQLDVRFELCNGGVVDASDATSAPLSVNANYNPDGLPSCDVPDGHGGFTKMCGVTVGFRNVTVTHSKKSGTIDFIAHKSGGHAQENKDIANQFTSERKILDPSAFKTPLDNMNGQLRVGAKKAMNLLSTGPLFNVVFALNPVLDDAPAASVGPFATPTTLPGELFVELRQEQFAKLEVAGSSGCNGSSQTSIGVVGHNFTPSTTGLYRVHDATRSVADATGVFHTDGNGDFSLDGLSVNAQTGDRIEVYTADAFGRTATGALDPIQYCIG